MIRNSSIFSDVSFSKLREIMSDCKVPSDSYLFWEDDPSEQLYYLHKGNVKMTKPTGDGKEIVFYHFHEGDLFGLWDPYRSSKMSYNAVTMDECRVGIIQRGDLECLLDQSGRLAGEFIRWMGMMHRHTQTKLRDLTMYGKPGALCSTLIRLGNTYGEKREDGIIIRHKLTHSELGNYIGAARESVNRMLHHLKKSGAVDFRDGYIVLKDLDCLKKLCFCDDCPIEICRM